MHINFHTIYGTHGYVSKITSIPTHSNFHMEIFQKTQLSEVLNTAFWNQSSDIARHHN